MCKYTLKICWTTLFHKNIFHKSHSQNFGGCDVPTNLFSPIYLLLSQSFAQSIVTYQTILLYKNIFHKSHWQNRALEVAMFPQTSLVRSINQVKIKNKGGLCKEK